MTSSVSSSDLKTLTNNSFAENLFEGFGVLLVESKFLDPVDCR